MHQKPVDDAGWEFARGTYPPGRTFGGSVGGRLVGTTMSLPMPLVVPGGAEVPTAAVTRVGVRADHTRRGVLTALMGEQLAAIAAGGEPLAVLRASEYPIYGRFGYGVASRAVHVSLDPRRSGFHPGAPVGGCLRLVEPDEWPGLLPAVYARAAAGRVGTFVRSGLYWDLNLRRPGDDQHKVCVVHTGPDGDDGYVLYTPEVNAGRDDPFGTAVQVLDLQAAGVAATAALWRFVLGVDLTNEVRAWCRPLDEPLSLLLADPRVGASGHVDDELWLRLVDVPAALAARSWSGDGEVLLGVRDGVLPGNAGCYRISREGVSRVELEPQLECEVAVLSRLYLGDVAPSVLAATGWLRVLDAAALPVADAVFATGVTPWCGTFF